MSEEPSRIAALRADLETAISGMPHTKEPSSKLESKLWKFQPIKGEDPEYGIYGVEVALDPTKTYVNVGYNVGIHEYGLRTILKFDAVTGTPGPGTVSLTNGSHTLSSNPLPAIAPAAHAASKYAGAAVVGAEVAIDTAEAIATAIDDQDRDAGVLGLPSAAELVGSLLSSISAMTIARWNDPSEPAPELVIGANQSWKVFRNQADAWMQSKGTTSKDGQAVNFKTKGTDSDGHEQDVEVRVWEPYCLLDASSTVLTTFVKFDWDRSGAFDQHMVVVSQRDMTDKNGPVISIQSAGHAGNTWIQVNGKQTGTLGLFRDWMAELGQKAMLPGGGYEVFASAVVEQVKDMQHAVQMH